MRKLYKCGFCRDGAKEDLCEKQLPSHFVCTRHKGHKGDHVACSSVLHDISRQSRHPAVGKKVKAKPKVKKAQRNLPYLLIERVLSGATLCKNEMQDAALNPSFILHLVDSKKTVAAIRKLLKRVRSDMDISKKG